MISSRSHGISKPPANPHLLIIPSTHSPHPLKHSTKVPPDIHPIHHGLRQYKKRCRCLSPFVFSLLGGHVDFLSCLFVSCFLKDKFYVLLFFLVYSFKSTQPAPAHQPFTPSLLFSAIQVRSRLIPYPFPDLMLVPWYLCRMPVLQTKIEGRGNGIKTVIPNMSDVARALARPPSCLFPTFFLQQQGEFNQRVPKHKFLLLFQFE